MAHVFLGASGWVLPLQAPSSALSPGRGGCASSCHQRSPTTAGVGFLPPHDSAHSSPSRSELERAALALLSARASSSSRLPGALRLCHARPAADGAAPAAPGTGLAASREDAGGWQHRPRLSRASSKGDVALGMEMPWGFFGGVFCSIGSCSDPFVATQR